MKANETLAQELEKALKIREAGLTDEQRRRREANTARNKAIQEGPHHRMKYGCPKDKA